MDENDDKLLAAYDLTAWEAPQAPAGLVDRVIERARMPAAPPMKPARAWKRTAVIAGTAVAAAAAVLAFVVFGTERAPQNGGGLVRASTAQTLPLGPSSAYLDAGTELHWQRRGTHIDVVQLKGGVVWSVSPHDTLVVETGSPGATVASVEATGASLRTEVQMLNRTDARVIGIGSAVAALVSITTVVVYEGHVKATSNGQTVNIQPGATVQYPPSAPGNQPSQYAVGAGPIAPVCDASRTRGEGEQYAKDGKHIDALIALMTSYACKADQDVAYTIAIEACHAHDTQHAVQYFQLSEVGAHAEIYDACKKDGIDVPALIDAAGAGCDADAAKTKGEDFLNNGMDNAALAQFEESLKCKDDAVVSKMAYIASCRLKNLAKARNYFAKLGSQGSLVQVCMRFGIDPSAEESAAKDPGTCDEVSCVLDNYTGACCAKWKKVKKNDKKVEEKKPAEKKPAEKTPAPVTDTSCDEVSCVLQNYAGACCTKYKKTPGKPDCDAAAAKTKGEDFLNNGMDVAALSQFETSLRCKPDSQVEKMAFIASCRAKNMTKAKYYFIKLGKPESLLQVCIRYNIDPSK